MHFAILFSLDDLHILCTFMHVLKSALILGCIIPQQSCRLSELTWLDVLITSEIILLFIAELDVCYRSKLVTQRALAPTKHFGDERIASPTSEALLAT